MQPQVKKKNWGLKHPVQSQFASFCTLVLLPTTLSKMQCLRVLKIVSKDYSNMAFKLTVAIFRCIRFLFSSCDQ